MQVKSFLEHYQIAENPFRAEEARHDAVLGRIERECRHPDFEKICGDVDRPSTAIVCGERGSGKTAIRLQLQHAIEAHNRQSPDRRCLVVPYDDLNPVLDRFGRHVRARTADDMLRQFRLVDHMDAMLAAIVPDLVDQVLGELRGRDAPLLVDENGPKRFHQLDDATRRDLIMLQVCYDHPDGAAGRTGRLRKALRYRSPNAVVPLRWGAIVAGGLTVAAVIAYLIVSPETKVWLWNLLVGLLAVLALGLGARFGWLWFKTQAMARDLARSLRVLDRSATSFRVSLEGVKTEEALSAQLPRDGSEEPRYAMFARLQNVIRPFGYGSIVVLVDRIDEPTLISGEAGRMQAFVWPLLNNKFLQQDTVGIKLLLPLELRYQLQRERPEFFREARLDKQNFVEHLRWSGATLYDVCTARLNACRPGAEERVSLVDLFDASVTQQELVDVLDQMQQPRDAFKFLYELIQVHCANVPEDNPDWKIARPTLDGVRKHQSDRMSAMLRGVGPA